MLSAEEVLTESEVKVLQLVADGMTLEEAAARMNLHYQSVRSYMFRVRMKLESPTSENAVATAIRRGIID